MRSHGSIPPLQPAHRCSSDPQPPSAIGPPSSSTASASSYPPTPQPPLFNNKASHRPAVVHQGTEREQSGCRRLRRRTSHVASPARGLLAPPTRLPLVVASVHLLAASSTCQPSPRCPVLCCPDLPRFQSCNRAIADRDWRPLPVVAGCRLNRPHSGSSAFLQDAFRPLFFFVRPPPVSLDSLSCNRCQPHGAAFPLAACLVFGPPMRRAAAHIFLACRFSRT